MTKVIAVAAPIGGGKSALVAALAAVLGNARTLHFDDFELATRQSPQELKQWLEAGADFNLLPAPGFVEALIAKKDEASRFSRSAGDPSYVVVESPLGRAYLATAKLIDILIWVDTPLDIALARNLQSLSAAARSDMGQAPNAFFDWLESYLATYADVLHPILVIQRKRVSHAADFLLDGRAPLEEMVVSAVSQITGRH